MNCENYLEVDRPGGCDCSGVLGIRNAFHRANEPGKLAKDAVEFAKDAGRIVSGEGTQHGQKLGGSCSIGADCKGYREPGQSGNACCKGTCTTLVKDYAGVYFCPAECKYGPIAKPGSC